jgi:hypothetical protein
MPDADQVDDRDDAPSPRKRRAAPFLGRWHAILFMLFWWVLNPISYHIVQSRIAWHEAKGALEAIAALVWGPFASTIEGRNLQDCYRNAWMLLPYAASALGAAFAVQWFWRPKTRVGTVVRLVLWSLGWIAWFGSGFISVLMNMG